MHLVVADRCPEAVLVGLRRYLSHALEERVDVGDVAEYLDRHDVPEFSLDATRVVADALLRMSRLRAQELVDRRRDRDAPVELLVRGMLAAQNGRSGSRERHQARVSPEVREVGDVGLAPVERSLELADEQVRVILGPVAEHAVVDDVERAKPRSEDRLVAERCS